MVKDLVEVGVAMVTKRKKQAVRAKARRTAEVKCLTVRNSLHPMAGSSDFSDPARAQRR